MNNLKDGTVVVISINKLLKHFKKKFWNKR